MPLTAPTSPTAADRSASASDRLARSSPMSCGELLPDQQRVSRMRSIRRHPKAGHMTAIDQTCPRRKKSLRGGGRSLIAAPSSRLPFTSPRPGPGPLRGQHELPQHLVRFGSAGIARSTTGLRVINVPTAPTAQFPAPSPGAIRLSAKLTEDFDALCFLSLRCPSERLPRSPDAVQDNRQFASQGDTGLARPGALLGCGSPVLQV